MSTKKKIKTQLKADITHKTLQDKQQQSSVAQFNLVYKD